MPKPIFVEIIDVPLPRPRIRLAVMELSRYQTIRKHILEFLCAGHDGSKK